MGDITASALIKKFQYALDEKWGYIWGAGGLIWTEKRQEEATREQTIQYGSQWIGRHVVDCSGLFSWAFSELGGYMYHGSNTMWDKYTVSRGELKNGKRTDGHDLQPGTAVFVDHNGDKSHVGLYIGNGEVIEAASTQQGVIKSKITNKKWSHWAVLKGVIMNETETPGAAAGDDRPTLKKGSTGDFVQALQVALIGRGYSVGVKGADGIFGSGTEAGVIAFQKANGLKADGIVGQMTWAALDASTGTVITYTVTISGISKDQAAALLKEYPEADVQEERGEDNA